MKHYLEKQLLEFQHILYSSFGKKQTFKEKIGSITILNFVAQGIETSPRIPFWGKEKTKSTGYTRMGLLTNHQSIL